MNRIAWIDSVKGIGILLVVLGHSGVPEWAKSLVFTFHMPLFFFLSGYLFNYTKYQSDINRFIRTKFFRLASPYLISFIVLSLIWVGIKEIVSVFHVPYESPIFGLSLFDTVLSLLYGNGSACNPVYSNFALMVDPPLWFLPALFSSMIVLYSIVTICSRYGSVTGGIIGLLTIILGYVVSNFVFFPWGFDIACVSLVFTYGGYLLQQGNYNPALLKLRWIFPILIFLMIGSFLINGYVDMNERHYQNLLVFYVGGITGSLLVFSLSIFFSEKSLNLRCLNYLGSISLFIMIFHVPLMVYCIGPLQVITPGLYDWIQQLWFVWFLLALGLCMVTWRIASLIPHVKSLYGGYT